MAVSTPAVIRARMWAKWLESPGRPGGPHREDEIRKAYTTRAIFWGPRIGKVAT